MPQPARPAIVLRIAVAGNRSLPGEEGLRTQADALFAAIEAAVVSFHSAHIGDARSPGTVRAYSDLAPSLCLVSGLADGADQVLSEAFLAGRDDASAAPSRSIGAILPFDIDVYRDRSRIENVGRFDRLLGQCRYVIELDGRYADEAGGDAAAARRSRRAAYRAQAAVLLRQADLLIAVDDPTAEPGGGGTRETIGRALHLGVPVIHLKPAAEDGNSGGDSGLDAAPEILLTPEDLYRDHPSGDWRQGLGALVYAILAAPRINVDIGDSPNPSTRDRALVDERRAYEDELLEEFFAERPLKPSLRQKLWRRFEGWFRPASDLPSDDIPARFADWRRLARSLSGHYAGLYRGTFLLNFTFAVFAVCLAVGSLIVLIVAADDHGLGLVPWLILLIFGFGKLAVLVTIWALTRQANRAHWNEKAIDFRYLAERLRSMAYLPAVGNLRTRPPRSAGYATRASTQRMVDWLFAARVREVSPEEIAPVGTRPGWIRIAPLSAATAIRDRWIASQARYHARNEETMVRMNNRLEKAGALLNVTVIGVVTIDLVILLLPEHVGHALHAASPWLLFLAAVLPAAVASLNGIRFQSECARLADRSTQMRWLLRDLGARADTLIGAIAQPADRAAAPAPGHTMAVLDLAEDCAQVMLDEVSEWTFVYAKELVEP